MAEVLGIVASTGQLLAAASEAVRLALELRQALLKGPRRVQAHVDCLNSTISLLNTVHQQSTSASRSPDILCFVHAVNEKVRNLHEILQKHLRSISGGSVRKILGAVSTIKGEEKIKGAFVALEREKANLHLFISIEARAKLSDLISRKDMDRPRASPTDTGMLDGDHQPGRDSTYRVDLANNRTTLGTTPQGHDIQPSHRAMSDRNPSHPAENNMLQGPGHDEARPGQELQAGSRHGELQSGSMYLGPRDEQITNHSAMTMTPTPSGGQVPYPTSQDHSNISNTEPGSRTEANVPMPPPFGHRIRSKNVYKRGAIVHYGDKHMGQEATEYHPLDVEQEDQHGEGATRRSRVQVGHMFAPSTRETPGQER